MAYIRVPDWKDVNLSILVTSALVLSVVARLAVGDRKREKIFPSPRETLLPKLTESEQRALPYPPDLLPGARDVDTPYGAMRVYEFGPETGRKVLLVHGISTPCISLGSIALSLADHGCRVMLFDLWGRGYSEAPADLNYDNRLYASQIMFAIGSSDLEWKPFSLVGYSMGGAIAVDFASYFPKMIDSLVLLASASLIRPEHFSSSNKFLYSSGMIPEPLLLLLVKKRLQAGLIQSGSKKAAKNPDVKDAANAEATNSPQAFQDKSLVKSHPNVDMRNAVQTQVTQHDGFIYSFLSSIRHAPLSGQQATWKRIGLFLSAQATTPEKGWQNGKVLVIAGRTDPIIIPEELKEDIDGLIGKNCYEWEVVDAAHDFPSSKSMDTVKIIARFWGL